MKISVDNTSTKIYYFDIIVMPLNIQIISLRFISVNTFYFRFSVDKDDIAQVFKLGLAFDLTIDGAETMFPILTDTSIPIPVCSDDPFVLPGDGSIKGFVKAVGQNVGQTAVDVVLKQLGLEVIC